MRLGIYSDLVYQRDAKGLSTDRSFVVFLTTLAERVDEVVLFGRFDPEPGRGPHPVDGVEFVALPHYPSVFSVGKLVAATPRSCRIFSAEVERLDAVWLFGPAPLAVLFALIARRRKTPVFLGVRQDYPEYIRHRVPSRLWLWAVGVAHVLDLAFRLVARRTPTVTIGDELAHQFRRGRAAVQPISLSLVRANELVPVEQALARRWDGELRILSVGRLDPEKNPLLLLDVIECLRAGDRRWRLAVAGEGPLMGQVADEVTARGLEDAVELLGYVPHGSKLTAQYRSSHAFLHVSLTEGLPQVLVEAAAAGLPVVATDVGGVADALDGGTRGLLVPSRDAAAIVAALERIRDDPGLRERLVRAGVLFAADNTLEAQQELVLDFVEQELHVRRHSS